MYIESIILATDVLLELKRKGFSYGEAYKIFWKAFKAGKELSGSDSLEILKKVYYENPMK